VEHLPPPAFTRDHEAWLTTVVGQLEVLTRQFQTLPPDTKPEKVEALRVRIEGLQAEWWNLEVHRRIWEAYRSQAANPPAVTVPQGAGPRLNRSALIELYEEYWAARVSVDEASVPGGDAANVPSAERWEQLADRFETILHTAQTTEDADGALALHGRLLQGSCYLFASVAHFRADRRDAQLPDYLRGVRVLDWVVQHEGIAPAMPAVGAVPRYTFPQWPYVDLSTFAQPTILQARELLSDFCPWGAETYVMLAAGRLMSGFDWRSLPPYGSEKVSVAAVSNRWVPQLVERDMQEIVTGTFAGRMGAENFRWWKEPEPTYTLWCVSPRAYGLQASTVFGYTLKVNKLLFGGPEVLLIDVLKDVAFDKVGQWFGQGGGIHWALGHGGNLLGINVIDPHWLDPEAGWTFFVKGPGGVTQFKPSKMFKPDWGDLFKGALMEGLRYVERQEIDLLCDSIRPDNAAINAAFGDPKTYNGAAMPAILIRADVMGWQVMPDDRYRRWWHIVRYYRFDSRVVLGRVGLSESPTQRAARKAAEWEGTTRWPARSWERLPEPYGMRLHLNDFSPKAQILRLQIPKDVLAAWRTKATRDGKALRAELVLPDALARLGSPKVAILPVSEDLHVPGIDSMLDKQEKDVREARGRMLSPESKPTEPNLGGEATFILLNAPLLSSPDDWVDLYGWKLWLLSTPKERRQAILTQLGVKPPPELPYLLTEYTVRFLLEAPQTSAGTTAPAEQLAQETVRFLPQPGKPVTADVSDFGPGYLMLKQRYDGPVPELAQEPPAYPFTLCGVKADIYGVFESQTSRGGASRSFNFVAQGKFSGSTFQGTYTREEKRPKEHRTETGTVTLILQPPQRDQDGKIKVGDSVTVTSIEFDIKQHLDWDSGPYDASSHLTLTGGKLALSENSTLLTTRTPTGSLEDYFDPGPRGDMMRRRNPWLSLVYYLPNEGTTGLSADYTKEDHNPSAHPPLHKVERLTKLDSCALQIYFQWTMEAPRGR
jgi:hypothetical protein